MPTHEDYDSQSPEPAPVNRPASRPPLLPTRHAARVIVEFLVVLTIGILFARAFTAEAYIVPTGSMAPTLLGFHRDLLCPNCGYRFAVGLDESGRAARAACPNCGHGDLRDAPSTD